MRLKHFYILSACVATVGLLTSAIAFGSHDTKTQKQFTEQEVLKVGREDIRENNTYNHNQQSIKSVQSFSAVRYSHTGQSSQLNSASQLDKNSGFLILLFMSYVMVSLIILEVWYRNYKKQRDNIGLEFEQNLVGRKEDIEF